MQVALLPMAPASATFSVPICSTHFVGSAMPAGPALAPQLLLRQPRVSAAAVPAPAMAQPIGMRPSRGQTTRCPCCDGSCERDAREILQGRGVAHGSAEALGKTSVVCVGDSITSGVGASRAAATYPGHLQRLLGDDYVVTNLGACGAAMQRYSDLPYRRRVQWQAAQMARADIIVIMLGTNDARPPNWNTPSRAAHYAADYKALVDAMCASNGAEPAVYIAVPPPFYGHPGPEGSAVEAVNASVKAVVNGALPSLVPKIARGMALRSEAIPAFEALGGSELSRPELFPDGVHPNDEGYLLLAGVVLEALGLEAVPAEMRREELLVAPGAEPRLAPTLPGQQQQQQQQQPQAQQAQSTHTTQTLAPALSRKRTWTASSAARSAAPIAAPVVSQLPGTAVSMHASVSFAAFPASAGGFVASPDAPPGLGMMQAPRAAGATAQPLLLATRGPQRRPRASTIGPRPQEPAPAPRQAAGARSRSSVNRGARHHRGLRRAVAAQSRPCLSRAMPAQMDWAMAVPVAVLAR